MGVETNPASSVRNLGVIFDHDFNFRCHISCVCRTCFYHMWDIQRIRKHLSLKNAKTLAHALVTSRVDYCNSLLFGVACREIIHLQGVQKCLARIVTKSPPRTHSPYLLQKLHWLPVKFSIQFKINLLTFKILTASRPAYLHDMLSFSTSRWSERLNRGRLLSVPRTTSKAFSSCAALL